MQSNNKMNSSDVYIFNNLNRPYINTLEPYHQINNDVCLITVSFTFKIYN